MDANEQRNPVGALMTVAEVQRELRLGCTSVYRMLKSGELDSVRIGSARRITRASVERVILASRVEQHLKGRR